MCSSWVVAWTHPYARVELTSYIPIPGCLVLEAYLYFDIIIWMIGDGFRVDPFIATWLSSFLC